MDFGTNLRNLRIQRGYTQERLAKALQTSQASITAWERGSREPDFRTIKRLAEFFSVPMSALLPSEDLVQDDEVHKMAESLHLNPKLRLLFDRTRNFNDRDLDAMLAIAESIQRKQEE